MHVGQVGIAIPVDINNTTCQAVVRSGPVDPTSPLARQYHIKAPGVHKAGDPTNEVDAEAVWWFSAAETAEYGVQLNTTWTWDGTNVNSAYIEWAGLDDYNCNNCDWIEEDTTPGAYEYSPGIWYSQWYVTSEDANTLTQQYDAPLYEDYTGQGNYGCSDSASTSAPGEMIEYTQCSVW